VTEQRIRFAEIENKVPTGRSGIYEIFMDGGIPLKVGIAANVRERLLQHRASNDSGLKLKPGGSRGNPRDLESKKSILAKHLFYDESLTQEFDLKTEKGRRAFLDARCYIVFRITDTKDDARQIERTRERDGSYRYVGLVVKR
jgi:hypothetical protein